MVETDFNQQPYATNLVGTESSPQCPEMLSLYSYFKSGIFIEFSDANPQQGDIKVSGPASGKGAGGGASTHDRRVPTDFKVGLHQ
ncbi:hypothetical protein PoB_007647500 [Plakobranchus ocellatus]|uniref:Uncharacterized protein n=1 Tax=Plakobranchus ocellatus TaxID=259542 RepID=A0AAV4E161_9GAST|nr:hypothetical protein PoB_007647500 [Plakobranchus ocellatus]